MVLVNIGGVPSVSMIVECGASCNVIDRQLWESLKENKNTLSSVESRLLGHKFCCQKRRCCYPTFSFGIQNECYMS